MSGFFFQIKEQSITIRIFLYNCTTLTLLKKMKLSALKFFLVCVFAFSTYVAAAQVNDSIKSELDAISILNSDSKKNIDKQKKGVLKGNIESINSLGVELISGINVKANLPLGLYLLEYAANDGLLDAQYNLGNTYFLLWLKNKNDSKYFSIATKWLRKAIKTGDLKSYNLLGLLYFEYGKHSKNPQFMLQSETLLLTLPEIDIINNKDETLITTQALLGTINLEQWRVQNDTASLRDAKKWYRMVLSSEKEYPNFTKYIDSLALVLSQGVSMSIDPKSEQPEPQNAGMGGFGGGMGGAGGGMGGAGRSPDVNPGSIAQFPGGQFAMMQFIRSNTFYPKPLKDSQFSGSVTVEFTIGTDGAIINPVVTTTLNHLLEKEALRTIMLMPDWTPAKQDKVETEFKTRATVSFGSSNMGGGMGGMMF